jgi:hypothetical protein
MKQDFCQFEMVDPHLHQFYTKHNLLQNDYNFCVIHYLLHVTKCIAVLKGNATVRWMAHEIHHLYQYDTDLEFDSDDKLEDCACLDAVNGENNEDHIKHDMNNYKGRRENFTGSVKPHGVAKQGTEIVDIFELYLNREIIYKTVKENYVM